MTIEESAGYLKLLAAVEKDEAGGNFHDYRAKLTWAVARSQHYAEKTGLIAADILNAWEARRNYWYMNYYQECNQPEIKAESVRVFDTVDALLKAIGDKGFRCPNCGQVSASPYECKAKTNPCDWKAYGLLGHLGKGIGVFVKEAVRVENIFMPIAWEPPPAVQRSFVEDVA